MKLKLENKFKKEITSKVYRLDHLSVKDRKQLFIILYTIMMHRDYNKIKARYAKDIFDEIEKIAKKDMHCFEDLINCRNYKNLKKKYGV